LIKVELAVIVSDCKKAPLTISRELIIEGLVSTSLEFFKKEGENLGRVDNSIT